MRKQILTFKKLSWVSLLLIGAFTACREEQPVVPETKLVSGYGADVVYKWNEVLLDVERFTPGYLPPVSARAFVYIGLAEYETAIPGMPDFKSLANRYPGMQLPYYAPNTNYSYPLALNSAYATMISRLYPTAPAAQLSEVITLQNQINHQYGPEVSPDEYEASIEWGEAVAEAVYAWSHTDAAGHEG